MPAAERPRFLQQPALRSDIPAALPGARCPPFSPRRDQMDASNYRRTLVAAAMGLALAASPAYASSVDDATLTAKVKTALMTDSKAPAMNVNVETRNGVVQLNGYVGTDAERKAAEQRARKVEGVKKVEN